MEALKIEILNPRAMQLIKGMEDLNLIKVSEEPETRLKNYLKSMRKNSSEAPGLNEIQQIVDEVRQERYAQE